MNEKLKSWISQNKFNNYCELNSISSECPWKIYEGLTTKEFIDINFSAIKTHTNMFHHLVKNACIDIVFVESFVEKLQKNIGFVFIILVMTRMELLDTLSEENQKKKLTYQSHS